MTEHPILTELKTRIKELPFGMLDEGESEVIARGKPFISIERPKGFRHRMAMKSCYRNAGLAAASGRANYVEGFIGHVIGPILIHHAWITLDGVHAIDQTLQHAPDCLYYGVEFTPKEYCRLILDRKYFAPVLRRTDPSDPEGKRSPADQEEVMRQLWARFQGDDETVGTRKDGTGTAPSIDDQRAADYVTK